MKYKNIGSAGHNFCHSFLSLMNYDSEKDIHVIDTIKKVRNKGYTIEINFLNGEVHPNVLNTVSFRKNLGFYLTSLPDSFRNQNIQFEEIKEFRLLWNNKDVLPIYNIRDSRGKEFSGTVKTHGN